MQNPDYRKLAYQRNAESRAKPKNKARKAAYDRDRETGLRQNKTTTPEPWSPIFQKVVDKL